MSIIIWQQFKDTLLKNPELNLQFKYTQNKRVDASYHITEIKQAHITSVDCGGVVNRWTEIIVQLYEPAGRQQLKAMQVNKALSIIAVVEKALPLDASATVKIEFGNSAFDVRQMLPSAITIDGDDLVVDLQPGVVQCKAVERGGNCGTPATKSVIQLKSPATTARCEPASGCC